MNGGVSGLKEAHRLVTVWGGRMLPLIPHRSLLGLIPMSGREVRPGDIVAWATGDAARARRVIRVAGEGEELVCMSDRGREVSRIVRSKCAGVAVWRSCHGFTRSLVFAGGAAGALYLAIRRLELDRKAAPFLPILAVLRRLLGSFIAVGEERSPLAQETPYLIHSLRSALFPAAEPLRPPAESVDWDVCLDLALRHGVEGIVEGPWSALPAGRRPPARVLEVLKCRARVREETWYRSLERLGSILPSFSAGGIPALVLKGPAIAWSSYPHPAARPFNDLDILVPREKRDQALAALSSAGYNVKAGAVGKGLIFRGHFHVVLTDGDYIPPVVELHWDLLDRANFFRVDLDELFRRARTLELPGAPAMTLSQVDEFIYLCLHLCKHGVMNGLTAEGRTGIAWLADGNSGNRLIWFVDLLRTLSIMAGSVSATELRESAVAWNAEEQVETCLLLTRKLFPAALPVSFLGMLPPASGEEAGEREPSSFEGGAKKPFLLLWAMRPLPGLVIRPIRLLELKRLFFPSPKELRRYYGIQEGVGLLPAYLKHLPHMLRRLLGGE